MDGPVEASRTHEVKEIDELGRRLAARVPAQQRATIVHGDFRLDNVVYDEADPGRINAVLDWGSPLSVTRSPTSGCSCSSGAVGTSPG